jgi:hypothetical protein
MSSTKPDGYVFRNWREDYPNWGKSVEGSPDYSCAICVNDRMFGNRQEELYQPVWLADPKVRDWIEKARTKLKANIELDEMNGDYGHKDEHDLLFELSALLPEGGGGR